ncbi:hypothetical protein MLV16_20740 [Escherichia coli]|uniref:hypothetical protein n=1 Tax=Escherichia coli TaxID=562 RepID=UPI0020C1166C|nr:hypothetical protein [Escherichia coli]EKS1633020.1 hypothetical protein [Escherichia coli]ELZ4661749.1 hypothetical protein [Escherichia coli]MCN8164015.1 hypothetical protein [Escherichia coli]MCO0407006.1 hypothetical protein [Escherichia coli]
MLQTALALRLRFIASAGRYLKAKEHNVYVGENLLNFDKSLLHHQLFIYNFAEEGRDNGAAIAKTDDARQTVATKEPYKLCICPVTIG